MVITHEDYDKDRIELRVDLDVDETDVCVEAAYAALGTYLELESDIDVRVLAAEKLTPEDLSDFLTDFVMDAVGSVAISEDATDITLEPEYTASSPVKEGEGFSFTLLAWRRPVNKLSSYDAVTVTVPPDIADDQRDVYLLGATALELSHRLEGELPEDMVASVLQTIQEEFTMELELNGMTREEYIAQQQGLTEPLLEKQLQQQARDTLRQDVALDAFFVQRDMHIDDADIQAVLTSMDSGNEDALLDRIESIGRMYAVEEAARRLKANKYLVDTAIIK